MTGAFFAACSDGAGSSSGSSGGGDAATDNGAQGAPDVTVSQSAPDTEADTAAGEDTNQDTNDNTADADEPGQEFRTDLTSGGNRFVEGRGSVLGEPVYVELPARAQWVLPWPDVDQPGWLVTLVDGSSVLVDESGVEVRTGPQPPTEVPGIGEAAPPIVISSDPAASPEVRSAYADHERFDDPLPDTRVVRDGQLTAALVGPTDRYPHDVLGDALEASAVEVIDEETGIRTRIEIAEPAVIEGISPLLGDVDQDGSTDVLVTISDAAVGARLAAYRSDGTFIAASDPIGQGRRWRNQLAVGPVGPDGAVEIVDVRTPHIGGTVEFFRPDGDRLVRVAASDSRFTSHSLGSRNLDLAIMADGNGDGRPDIIVPTSDRRAMAVITRTDDSEGAGDAAGIGGVEVTEVALDGSIDTNFAARPVDGQLDFAVGVTSERTNHALVIWPR